MALSNFVFGLADFTGSLPRALLFCTPDAEYRWSTCQVPDAMPLMTVIIRWEAQHRGATNIGQDRETHAPQFPGQLYND